MNHNRNSIRVLHTTGAGWFMHRNIPNLSVAADADFTILLWVVTGEDLDGELYGQEGGFILRLTGGVVSFSREGFGHLAALDDWSLTRNARTLVAVRRKGGLLTLFLGGQPAAQTDVSDAAACTGDFFIGRRFAGGLAAVQVSRRALEDGEILSANAVLPTPDADCVFCSDCETVQYRDVSANHLPMWTEGEGACCGVCTACTWFDGWRQCLCAPGKAQPAKHTLLVKLWPQLPRHLQTRCRVYEAGKDTEPLYALELEPQENGTFRLLLVGGGMELACDRTLLPQLWQDVAVVFDGAQASFYLDGASAGGGAFACAGGRARLAVGAPEGDNPEFMHSFEGYLAYTAEFDHALTAREIAGYADDPPFLFAPGLVSLLMLDWDSAPEGISAAPLTWIGGAGFCLAAGITSRDTPVGVSVRLPETVSPEWEAMSEIDRWCLETLEECARLTFSGMSGLPVSAANGPPRAAHAPQLVRRHLKGAYQRLHSGSPAPTAWDAVELETMVNYPGAQGMAITLQGPPVAAGGAETVTTGVFGAAVGFVQRHPRACAAAMAVAAGVGFAMAEAERKRPPDKEKETDPSLESICWCDKGDPETGSLYFHRGGLNKPGSMEWPLAESCAVLVPGLLTSPSVKVRVSLPAQAKKTWNGTLTLSDISESRWLGDAVSDTFALQPGETKTVMVPYRPDGLRGKGFARHDHVWQIRAGGSRANAKATLYLLPAAPIAPWRLGEGAAYDPAAPDYIDTVLLDFFLPQNGQPADWRQWMTRRLNSSGFVYDLQGGGNCHYCDFHSHTLRLQALLADLSGKGKVLNCADCAHIVSAACAMVGQELYIHWFIGSSGGFECNQIVAIGDTAWHYPFEEGGRGGFGYHMFNVASEVLTANVPVYDACLQVDAGPWPGWKAEIKRKKALLPEGMPACETSSFAVDVPTDTPYEKDFYRERLVKTGWQCGFAPGVPFRVAGFLSAAQEALLRPAALPLAATRARGLDGALTAGPPLPPGWTPSLPDAECREEGERYHHWSLIRAGRPCRVEHWACEDGRQALERLAARAVQYADPRRRRGAGLDLPAGEVCVVVGSSVVLFCRRAQVFAVEAPDLETARQLALELDGLVPRAEE